MKDESPRIFRNLEKTAGRDGFDTIVGAAVATYGSLRAPNDTQVRDFGRLVDPLWTKIAPETRRAVAAALSNSSRVPRAIVGRLVAEPVEISAPFLTSSPALEPSDLATLAASADGRVRKILESRVTAAAAAVPARGAPDKAAPVSKPAEVPALSPSPAAVEVAPVAAAASAKPEDPLAALAAAIARKPAAVAATRPGTVAPQTLAPEAEAIPASLTAEGSADTDNADTRRGTTDPEAAPPAPEVLPPLPATPLLRARSAPPPADVPGGTRADLVRETLRRLALAGRTAAGPVAEPAPKLQDLVALAVRQEAEPFYAGLRRKLMLPSDMLVKIAEDESGERLAVALKAMRAKSADALTILMMLKPRIGLDVEAFGKMQRYYQALKPEDCAVLTGSSLRRQTVEAPSLQPQYQDLDPLERAAPRPIFGRRASRPGEQGKDSKRA